VGKRHSAHRLQLAIVDLQRITNSRRLHSVRSTRSGVDLSPAAGAVLRRVVDEGPVRPGVLAQRSRMGSPALSRQLKSLEADRCIERVPAPDDGRGALLRATRRGRSLVDRLEQADQAILEEQLRSWSAADLAQLVGLMERLVHDLRTPAPSRAEGAGAARRPRVTAQRRDSR
jgi:DNA-binding MarR family transcriptional regulator